MIDRKKAPKIVTQFDIQLTGVGQSELKNGIPIYEIKAGSQKIIKIDYVLRAGRVHEQQRGAAKAAFALLREGSTRHNSEELAHIYDFHGATVKVSTSMEITTISLIVLERFFAQVWPVWLDMLRYPAYADKEIEKYIQLISQKMRQQLAKNDIQAYRKVTELIFGQDHPYGYNTTVEDLNALERNAIVDHYNANFATDIAFVVLSGNYKEEVRQTIYHDLGQLTRQSKQTVPAFSQTESAPVMQKMTTENEHQISLKMARRLFPSDHPDYSVFKVLNMVLGGYFGSRLMRNLREEKGYTYGIYSATHTLLRDGYFYISAEVGSEYVDATREEIRNELALLRAEEIDAQELDMVKNYIIGQSLHNLDGPFAKASLVRELVSKHLSFAHLKEHISVVKAVTPYDLQEMAMRYLDPNMMTTVLVGG